MPDLVVLSGQTVVFPITARTQYRITHDGWTLRVECTNGEPLCKCNHDGTISIGSSGGDHDGEL